MIILLKMIPKDRLKQILFQQREAILKKPLGIERSILKTIEQKAKLPHVVVLTGLRRCGKSTLLRQIIDKLNDDFYYISFEDERLFNFRAEDFDQIYESLVELFGEKKTFLIDEIQNITGFESFVRRFYDSGFKFFITGSSAKLLSKEIGTKLTGRHVDIIVKPFSFVEFLRFRDFKAGKQDALNTAVRAQIKKHFADYLEDGGMPEYVQYKDPEVLTKTYEDIVLKDIAARYRIDNVLQLRELYQYLITNMSQRFSYNSLKKFIRIGSANTIKKYIDFLEETYLISQVNRFDFSLKKQIVNDKKAYVVDNGLFKMISIRFTQDKGWLLENAVFAELRNRADVFYYSDISECDFLMVKNKTVNGAVQVCWSLNQENKEREINGLLEAMEKFKLKTGMILTNDQEEEYSINNRRIIVMPAWKFMLSNK